MRSLPPLNSLKAFESAARLQSFTKAAEELCVTQGAVSKQVRLLEDFLGVRLFVRKHHSLQLTNESASLLPEIQSAFTTIETATRHLRSTTAATSSLTINTLPSLASSWLIPRVLQFRQQHPRFSIDVSVGDGAIDFEDRFADLAIRSSKLDRWPNYQVDRLFKEELIPVCSPQLTISNVDELPKYPLLKHMTRPDMWSEFLAGANIDTQSLSFALGLEHYFMIIQAAINGYGIALIPKFLIENELTNGSLRAAFDYQYESPYAYYLICPKQKADLEAVITFKAWLRTT